MDGFDIKVAVGDSDFNWAEAERLAALPDFGVLAELQKLREEVEKDVAHRREDSCHVRGQVCHQSVQP